MQHFNLNVHSHYSLLESILSIDDIINHALSNNLNYAILTDKNLYGAIEFYTKAKNNHLKPIIGLDISFQNDNLILIAKNLNGFKSLIKISSLIETEQILNIDSYFNDDLFVISKLNIYQNNKLQIWNQHDIFINTIKYNHANDYSIYKVLEAIKNNKIIDDIETIKVNDVYAWINDVNVSLKQKQNFEKIINECEIIFEIPENKLPKYNEKKDSKKYLHDLALDGLMELLKIEDNKIPKKYYDRLIYELDVINELGYNDYFLIVADFVNFAKKNDIIIGPGRGSAAGSLVSYCLNITEIDPIKYNLFFERFLNKDRKTMPDIDIDVMDNRRDELIEYIFNKYEIKNTSQIITFQRIKYKMAIRDVGRVLNIPLPIINKITKEIDNEINSDLLSYVKQHKILKTLYDSYPNLFIISNKLYNIPRQFSTHAAGILIANMEMSDIIPIQKGINNYQLSQWSMEYLEKFGLNKIDILGLKNLSVIHDAVKLIKQRHNQNFNLKEINLEDKKVFSEIKKTNTLGIFQLESNGMRATLAKIQPENLEDISITSALFRPGPQMMIDDYVKTRKNKELIKYIHEDLKDILSPTNGFCIYQEQVIEIIKIMTGFSTAKADIFRRAISKKKIELFDQMKKDFFDAALKKNYDIKIINNVYDWIIEFANYGFNHSHSIAYALISYQMMYLKCYYPLEFMLSLLKNENATNLKDNIYLNEAKKYGIQIYNIDLRYVESNFSIYKDGIMIGLNAIKGFGTEIVSKIIDIKEKNEFNNCFEIISSLYKNNISIKNIEILIKIGAFDNLGHDRKYLLENLKNIIKTNFAIDPISKKPIFDSFLIETAKMDAQEKLSYEMEYLGYSFANIYQSNFYLKYKEEYNLISINKIENNTEGTILAEIKSVRKIKTKNNHEMAFIDFIEGECIYNLMSFNQEIYDHLQKNNFYILKIRNKNEKLSISSIVKNI